MSQATKLREMLARPGMIVAPGIYDGMSARLGRMAGFEALYATGGGIARSTGVPDINLIDPGQIVQRLSEICDAVDCPVIGDADTGYGNALNAYRVIRQFARIGLAGVHLEDQTFPKRCGHLNDKSIVKAKDFVPVLKAAKDADPDIVIIARTDAIAVEGIEATVERVRAYEAAGADAIFPDAVRGREDIAAIVGAVRVPVRINMGFGIRTRDTTPLMSIPALKALGVRWVSLSRMLPAAAIKGMTEALTVMREAMMREEVVERADLVVDMKAISDLMGYASYMDVERAFLPAADLERRYGGDRRGGKT